MKILSYLLFGLVCAAFVILMVCMVFCISVISSRDKEVEDEDQIKWLKERQERKLGKGCQREGF